MNPSALVGFTYFPGYNISTPPNEVQRSLCRSSYYPILRESEGWESALIWYEEKQRTSAMDRICNCLQGSTTCNEATEMNPYPMKVSAPAGRENFLIYILPQTAETAEVFIVTYQSPSDTE